MQYLNENIQIRGTFYLKRDEQQRDIVSANISRIQIYDADRNGYLLEEPLFIDWQ